ncbi:hypothetical protein [Paenibacillus senegalensis]|nr:hypothetical protein [Paenibacillus senegalensis]
MPLIPMKKFWTPLEWLGIQLYYDEDKQWYIKRKGRAIRRMKK